MAKPILQLILLVSCLITAPQAQTADPLLPVVEVNTPDPALPPVLAEPVITPPSLTIPEPLASTKVAKPKPKKPANVFSGKLTAVDKANLTLTIETKAGKSTTYAITPESRMSKGGKPSTFSNATVGDSIRGVFAKSKEGKLKVVSLDYGAPVIKTTEDSPAPKKAKSPKKVKTIKITPIPATESAPVPATTPAPTPIVQ